VERPVYVPRPALVISRAGLGPDDRLLWVLMITNAQRESWPGDLLIPNAPSLGLLVSSKIRTAKVTTVEIAQASLIGRLDDATLAQVTGILRQTIG
jgi:mRNA interferase MazF